MRRNRNIRFVCVLLAALLCLSTLSSALAAREEYTMAGKLLKQLWAGSGFSGTLEVSLSANGAAQGEALVTTKPFLIDWDYIYVRPTTTDLAQHRLDASLMDGDAAVTEAHFQFRDGTLAVQSPLLGEGWYAARLEKLLENTAGDSGDTLAAQMVPGLQKALNASGMPALMTMALPQILRFQEKQDDLAGVLEQMTLRMDLWIEGYRQGAVLGKLDDGSTIIDVNYVVSPANIKAQAKQMVFDALNDETVRSTLAACLEEEMAALMLNPEYQPYYFAAIDALPLSGDLTLSRSVDMKGETVSLHLSLPFYDARGGAMTLRYDRERGAGDLPDTNTLTMESGDRSVILSYLTYRSMTDVTVYQGTVKVVDQSAESFAVKPEGEAKPLPDIAFTLSRQTTETKEDGDLNVYTDNWQMKLEPDPAGKNPEAFLPLTILLDSRFASKTPQTSATKADILLTISGEEKPQTVEVRFTGETRRQWQVEEVPADRTDLLSLSGEGLEALLANLLTEGGQVLSFFAPAQADADAVDADASVQEMPAQAPAAEEKTEE